ncbi:MAG: WhiB family transcriptional regulator [Dermatophilus congolensis]|nr:WhiB family transcriptional regulator [Dermatophilus congolensis]
MTTSTQWTARAACAGRLDLPWTTDAADVTLWQAATMRAICADCPVLFDCLNAVDDLDVTGGWWAGHDRDPAAQTAHLDPPAWATDDPAPSGSGLVASWVPVRGKRGRLLAEQGAFALDGVGVA